MRIEAIHNPSAVILAKAGIQCMSRREAQILRAMNGSSFATN